MKRFLAAAVSISFLLFFFAGCSGQTNTEKELKPARELTFSIDRDQYPHQWQSAEVFAKQVSSLSAGTLQVKLVDSSQPVKDMKEEQTDFILALPEEIPSTNGLLRILNTGFLFKNARQLGLSLNRQATLDEVLEELEKQTGGIPLGAVQEESDLLITRNFELTGLEAVRGKKFISIENKSLSRVIELNGGSIESGEWKNISNILSDEEADGIILPASRLQSIPADAFSGESQYYLCSYPYSVGYSWLLARASCWNSLTAPQKDALTEAAAYLMGTQENIMDSAAAQAIKQDHAGILLTQVEEDVFFNEVYGTLSDWMSNVAYPVYNFWLEYKRL